MSNTYNFTSLQSYNSPWAPGITYTVGGYFNIANTVSSAGFTNGDTITATGLIPEGGVKILQVLVCGSPGDTNGSPTGTFKVGDSLADSGHDARYISAASFAKDTTSTQLIQYQNVTPAFTNGVQTAGVGYSYTTNENSNSELGAVDIILTVTASMATAATSGVVYIYVTYACTGDI